MMQLQEAVRELPISPVAFGVVAFVIMSFLLYVVLRLDK
jgi:hypothetical protein